MISFKEKILQLKGYIEEALLPLIDNDYVLWDLPYHNNIGDLGVRYEVLENRAEQR